MYFEFERTTPESLGIPSEALSDMMKALQKEETLHGIMLLRHGKVCLEGWWKPYRPELPHMLFSLSKSFTSLAIGFARAEKKLSLSDTLLSFFPEYDPAVSDPKMRKVTLRHLLTMNSGHSDCIYYKLRETPDGDWVRCFLASKLDHEPGTFFVYNTAATYMLSAVIRKVTGMNVREYLIPRLFEPLGIDPGRWETCPKGINTGGTGFYLKTGDLARVGQLLLQHGEWNGKQILAADYLDEATCKQIDTGTNHLPDWKEGYGYQFWISRHGFRGDGACGQFIIVLPREDVVIAINAAVNMQNVLDVFWSKLLPVLQDSPLPENTVSHSALLEIMKHLEIPRHNGGDPDGLSGATWQFESNSAGITAVDVSFPDQTCRMEFHSKYGREILTAGFGGIRYTSYLHLNDSVLRPVAAEACRTAEDKIDINLYCLDGPFRDIFHLDFSNGEQPLKGEYFNSLSRKGFLPDLLVSGK